MRVEESAGAIAVYVVGRFIAQLWNETDQITNTYGAFGAAIVLLLWFYITAIAVLFGGELAAYLEGGVRKR